MSIRKIHAPVLGSDESKWVVEAALGLGEAFGASVEVFHPKRDPARDLAYLGPGATGMGVGVGAARILEAAEAQANEQEAKARAAYDEATRGRSGRHAFVVETGREAELMAAHARLADLTVLARPQETSSPTLEGGIEACLFESGRPIYVVPPAPTQVSGKKVGIAWNDSPEAAHALAAAIPFLEKAEMVTAISIGGYALEKLGEYLSTHGITSAEHSVEPERGGLLEDTTGEQILDICRHLDLDLLVMGAFTHLRIRQLMVAGATRTILARSEIPILMAH